MALTKPNHTHKIDKTQPHTQNTEIPLPQMTKKIDVMRVFNVSENHILPPYTNKDRYGDVSVGYFFFFFYDMMRCCWWDLNPHFLITGALVELQQP